MTAVRMWGTPWLTLAVLIVVMLATIGAWEVYKGTVRFAGNAWASGMADHLFCYHVKWPEKYERERDRYRHRNGEWAVNQEVIVFDQFHLPATGGLEVVVGSPHFLCTPAVKQVQRDP